MHLMQTPFPDQHAQPTVKNRIGMLPTRWKSVEHGQRSNAMPSQLRFGPRIGVMVICMDAPMEKKTTHLATQISAKNKVELLA